MAKPGLNVNTSNTEVMVSGMRSREATMVDSGHIKLILSGTVQTTASDFERQRRIVESCQSNSERCME